MCGESTIHGEDIQQVRELIEKQDFCSGRGSEQQFDIVTPYVDEITSQFHFARKVKLVVDGGNGVGGPVFHRMIEKLNVEAREQFIEMDGNFPNHDPDPTQPENLEQLDRRRCANSRSILGIAFDGDSDRIGAVDENGELVFGDMLLLIYGREILARKPGATVIGEVKCSQVLVRRAAQRRRQRHHVEDRPLADQGEDEGNARRTGGRNERPHVLRRSAITASTMRSTRRAGCWTSCANPANRFPRSWRTFRSWSPHRNSVSIAPDETKFAVVKRVKEHFQGIYEVMDVDGARINFAKGWGLVRASNTQPVLVMRFEAANAGAATAIPRRSGTGVAQLDLRASHVTEIACRPA